MIQPFTGPPRFFTTRQACPSPGEDSPLSPVISATYALVSVTREVSLWSFSPWRLARFWRAYPNRIRLRLGPRGNVSS